MMRKFLILLVGVFMMSGVLGFGISPARTTLDFKAGMERDVSFDVINSEGEDISFVFLAQGDLAEYIFSDVSSGSILASEKSKSFSYSLKLPELLEPGLHKGEVVVMQLPDEGSGQGSQVLATLAVATQIYLYVPYPGKYANAKLYVYSANVGEVVKFVIPVSSAGEFDLTSVRANVDVYDKAGEVVDSFNVGPIAIPSGQQRELVYDWDADVPIGDYVAKSTVVYGDGTVSLEEKFSVGSEKLVLQEIWVDDFSLGEIAKLEMLVENKWSEKIADVLIKTKISNERGGVVSEFKSSDYDVGGFSKEVFVSYWDTAGVIEGDYDAEVSIKYGDKESRENLKFEVSENELVVIGLGYVISADDGVGPDAIVVVLMSAVVLLILLNLLWFLLLRKRLGK
ncbi:hypothetical protein K8R30_03580 [archaeon]|nr:hypothetical protein [archaeon]